MNTETIKEGITKSMLENVEYGFLKRNLPAVILIKGDDYVGFTEKFQKPFDSLFSDAMQETLIYLCENLPDCVFGYTKEFEFALVFMTAKETQDNHWFNMDVQKIASKASSMATLQFNRVFSRITKNYVLGGDNFDETKKLNAMQGYVKAIDNGAVFSARAFNIALQSIPEYIFMLQKESIESGITLMGRTYFTDDELKGRTQSEIQFMVFDRTGINFDSYLPEHKRGTACMRYPVPDIEDGDENGLKYIWKILKDTPLFKPEARDLFDSVLNV